jgi:hypothetical protein
MSLPINNGDRWVVNQGHADSIPGLQLIAGHSIF